MAPKYKIDATKRVITGILTSDNFDRSEKFSFLLGARSIAKILAGDEAGVTKLLQKYIDEGVGND